jgi:hypothetical protein
MSERKGRSQLTDKKECFVINPNFLENILVTKITGTTSPDDGVEEHTSGIRFLRRRRVLGGHIREGNPHTNNRCGHNIICRRVCFMKDKKFTGFCECQITHLVH